MVWISISGSWRTSCIELEKDLEREINRVLDNGDGIVTGGALGVDYQATNIVLTRFPNGNRLRVILPTSLDTYIAYYQKRADEGIITQTQTRNLIAQLRVAQKLHALIESPNVRQIDAASYYARNSAIVSVSNELIAFQVNKSAGTQDAIEKALKKNIPTRIFRYTVTTP
jgi:hypothetical protein